MSDSCCVHQEGAPTIFVDGLERIGSIKSVGRAAYVLEKKLIHGLYLLDHAIATKQWPGRKPFIEYMRDQSPCKEPLPPGKVLSAGVAGLEILDTPRGEIEWPILEINKNPYLIEWKYRQFRKTRGYVALLTKDGWDKSKPLSTEDFDDPFWTYYSDCSPFWDHDMPPLMKLKITFPTNKSGYHVLVIIWVLADIGCGHYQAIDVDLSNVPEPSVPRELTYGCDFDPIEGPPQPPSENKPPPAEVPVSCCGHTGHTFGIDVDALPRQGSITVGRAAYAEATKLITIENLANSAEATKQWPGRPVFSPKYQDKEPCAIPIPPGKAISVDVSGLEVLDKPRDKIKWPILKIDRNPYIFRWKYNQPHPTRGYVALLTKDGWNKANPLSTDDFDDPFWRFTSSCDPYWEHNMEPHHWSEIVFPTNKIGYHVLLVMWIVADTGCAFYQAVDVDLTHVPKPSRIPLPTYGCDYVPAVEPPNPTVTDPECCGSLTGKFSIEDVGRSNYAQKTAMIIATVFDSITGPKKWDQWSGMEPQDYGDVASCPSNYLQRGKVISAGLTGLELLDRPIGEIHWPVLKIDKNPYVFKFKYGPPHKTRGYIALLTKKGWDTSKPLSAEDFDDPFWSYISTCKPYSLHKMSPLAYSQIVFPTNKTGYHVLLIMCIIADGACAFYQAVDVDLTTVPEPATIPPLTYDCDFVQDPLPIHPCTEESCNQSTTTNSQQFSLKQIALAGAGLVIGGLVIAKIISLVSVAKEISGATKAVLAPVEDSRQNKIHIKPTIVKKKKKKSRTEQFEKLGLYNLLRK